MDKTKCPNCQKVVDPGTGRRPKVYCSPECRIAFNNGKKVPKNVTYATHQAVLKENEHLRALLRDLTSKMRPEGLKIDTQPLENIDWGLLAEISPNKRTKSEKSTEVLDNKGNGLETAENGVKNDYDESQGQPLPSFINFKDPNFKDPGLLIPDGKQSKAPKINYIASNDEIHKQIAAIQAEKQPEWAKTPLGIKSWKLDQSKRIDELKKTKSWVK